MRMNIHLKVNPKKVLSILTLSAFVISTTFTFDVRADNDKVVYPLKEVSKLECRFDEFSTLSSNCKEKLPVLNTKDYKKFIKKDGWYNKYTRLYTVLWGSSYKYGWDVWNGWHQWVDIATAQWTPVYSIADGTVIVSKKDPSWWNVVSIQHTIRWKKIVSNYAHLHKIDVQKWAIVKAGSIIWTVWSTWNSTGNHLHFQVDLEHLFHPFYYSWETCPYGYYEITEKWVCFDELAANTLDPLEFLEGEWAILDKIIIKKTGKSNQTIVQSSSKFIVDDKNDNDHRENTTETIEWFDMNIFNKTVHKEMWSSQEDIKTVQTIYSDLGYYNWKIDWNFDNVVWAIINFQLDKKLLSSKYDLWAGWFWPKTRAITRTEYTKYLYSTEWDKRGDTKVYINADEITAATSDRKIEKIDRKDILSREEIEAKEIENFLKKNEINFDLNSVWWNIKVWDDFGIKLSIQKIVNAKKRRPYKWALPGAMTFEIDEKTVSVFPKKMTTIKNGERDIFLKGLKTWNTTLKIKLGNQVIKTFDLKVFAEAASVFPKTAKILSQRSITLWESKTWIVLFKDDAGKNLINLPFKGSYILETWEMASVCIKKWTLQNIRSIYNSECEEKDYVKDPIVTYNDTVGGLLLFDYKVYWKSDSQIQLVWKWSGNVYSKSQIAVSMPKWLQSNHEYYNETISMLEKWIVSSEKKWYFMQDNNLSQVDAMTWIWNTLRTIKSDSSNPEVVAQATKKLVELEKDTLRSMQAISRKQFLDKAHKYLVVNDFWSSISIDYQDLPTVDNKKANAIFDENNTWKDKFGKTYFQPKQKVTRAEWAFLLSNAFAKSQTLFLTMK